MSITITKESDNLFVVEIRGIYTYDDQKQIEQYGDGNVAPGQKVKILVLAEQFAGWGKEGDWGDVSFMHKADPYIERMAIVAPEKWKDQMLMFVGAGRRQAQVEFFYEDETDDARDWLKSE